MMVKSKPTMAVGLSLGTNLASYHSLPLRPIKVKRVMIPAIKGIPRKMKTLRAMSHMVTPTAALMGRVELLGPIPVGLRLAGACGVGAEELPLELFCQVDDR